MFGLPTRGRCTLCGKEAGNLFRGTKCEECVKKFGPEGHPGPIMDRAPDNFTSTKQADHKKGLKQARHIKRMGLEGMSITKEEVVEAYRPKQSARPKKSVSKLE